MLSFLNSNKRTAPSCQGEKGVTRLSMREGKLRAWTFTSGRILPDALSESIAESDR